MERFNGRLTEILEVLKGLYEIEIGKYWCWQKLEPWTIQKISGEKQLLEVKGGGIYTTMCRIKLPDATPPNRIHFTIDVKNEKTGDKYTIIGANPKTLDDLALNTPNPFGYTTIYDTTNYTYAWFEPWMLNFRPEETATVKLTNETPVDITVEIISVDGYTRPLGRYMPAEVP